MGKTILVLRSRVGGPSQKAYGVGLIPEQDKGSAEKNPKERDPGGGPGGKAPAVQT